MPRQVRTTIQLIDVKAEPPHVNDKGIKIEGIIVVSVKVNYGRKYSWTKAYGFLPKDLANFSIDEFKNQIYRESRIWIKESDLQKEALKHLKAVKNEIVYLD